MGRDTIQLETAINTISHEYLLEFTSEYGIPKTLHPELLRSEDRIVDFPEGKVGVYTRFFEFPNFRFPQSKFLFDVIGYYQIHLSQLSVIGAAKVSHFEINYRVLNIILTLSLFRVFYTPSFNSGWMSFSKRPGKNTPQCYTKPLDSLKNWNNRFFWVDERVFPTVMDWRTNAPKYGMPVVNTYSIEAVRALDTHHMDLFNLIRAPNPTKGTVALEMPPSEDVLAIDAPGVGQAEEVAATDPSAATESHKKGRDGTDGNVPPKLLRRDHADPRPTGSSHGGKSLAAIQLGLASTVYVPENAPTGVSTTAAGDPDSENAYSPVEVRSPESIYRPEWGVANGSMLDTPKACQDLVDHLSPAGGNGVTVAPEVRARGKAAEKVCCSSGSPGQKNSSPEAGNKKPGSTTGDRGRYEEGCGRQECRANPRTRRYARFSDLQVSKERISQQVATLQEQVSGEEKLKAAFEEFKRYEDDQVEQRCAELDARLDALSIDFDEELYPHMLTAIAGRRWVIGHGLRLAVMKCGESLEMRKAFADVVSAGIAKGISEGLRHGVEHGQTQLNVESIEAYDPEAEAKFVVALQALKDLKYPLVDQLEGLKDAPMDVIMAAIYLESDTREVRDPRNPWAYREEMLLADAIAANISRAEKKKKCRIVCRTHGVGSAHHARSDGVSVSVPTVVPQGLALLLVDAATQTDFDT
nr:transposase (putative), gypsy type [Tanacetum cinerariifolium]